MASGMDMASLARFRRVISRTADETSRSASEVVKQAYIHFLQSGRKATKRGKSKRDVIDNPKYDAKRKVGDKFLIVVRHQDGRTTYIPTSSRADSRRNIRNRGLAKQSWNWMFAGISSAGASGSYKGTAKPSRIVSVSNELSRTVRPAIEYANRLRYLEIANPGVHDLALNKAANRMQALLDRKVRSNFERIWR